MKPSFLVNYTLRVLILSFKDEQYSFNLEEGDTGDFWHSFIDTDGIEWDINFYQESEKEEPSVAIYRVIGEIQEGSGVSIPKYITIGLPEEYFNYTPPVKGSLTIKVSITIIVGEPSNLISEDTRGEVLFSDLDVIILGSEGFGPQRVTIAVGDYNEDLDGVAFDHFDTFEELKRQQSELNVITSRDGVQYVIVTKI